MMMMIMGFGGRIGEALHGLKPALFMVIVQFGFAGVNVLYKLAANDGMNLRIIVAYRFLFATAFILPIALFVERKSRPKLTWMVLFQAFLCGLFGGSLAQNLYVESLALTSATFASAMTNLVPAITFLLAVSFRLEKANLGSITGKAKVLGASMGIGGAMLMTFYKGVELNIWSTHVNLLHTHKYNAASASTSLHGHAAHRLLGCLLAVGSCLCYALWLIIQTKISERYPCHYSSTALMSMMGSIQAIVFALCMERDWKQWKLGWNIRLLTVAYSGIVASALMVTLISFCVHMRGPLFVSVFNPLMLVLVAIAGSLVLNEKLHLGSVLAAAVIVIGLYLVLWGKGKEMKKITQLAPSESFDEPEAISIVVTTPSLDNKPYDKDDNNNKDNNDHDDDNDDDSNHNDTVTSSVVQAQPTTMNAALEN